MKSNLLLLFMFAFTATTLVAQEPDATSQVDTVAQQGAAYCSVPTPKSCPKIVNDGCPMKVVEHVIKWKSIYDESVPPVYIGRDLVEVTYPGCDGEEEDCPRDISEVNHCLLTNARTPEANSLPGPVDSKVCFIRRPCVRVANLGPYKETVRPQDADGHEIYTKPELNKEVFWAICASFAASADSSFFDVDVELEWTPCVPHNNCQRNPVVPAPNSEGPVTALEIPTETSR